MNLLTLNPISSAKTGASDAVRLNAPPRNLGVQANFAYGSGGTSVDVYVQTSFDGGATWCDIANFHFATSAARKLFNLYSGTPVTTQATPTDGSLASNTAVDGVLGVLLRAKFVTVGTYGGATSISVDISCDQAP